MHPKIIFVHQTSVLGIVLAMGCFVASTASGLRASPIVGQINNFQDNSLDNWGGGAVPSSGFPSIGGPGGSSDLFLPLTSSGGGPGGALATYNYDGSQWVGDYVDAGVDTVTMDLMSSPANITTLKIRVVIMSSTLATRYTSIVPYLLPNDGQWHHAVFSLGASDLTKVAGTDSYSSVIGNVGRLMVRYDLTPSSGGTPYAGSMGVDNITAASTGPEPSGLFVLLGGIMLVLHRPAIGSRRFALPLISHW